MDEAHKELIAVGRKYADGVDKDRGFESGLTDCLRGLSDALEAMAGEVERLKRMLSPYAEDKEISGMSWNGFYLIGNRKSIDELKRMENRSAQLETYRAEFVRRAEAAEAERDRLKAALETIAEEHDAGRHDGLPEPCPAHDADTMFYVARKALGDAS